MWRCFPFADNRSRMRRRAESLEVVGGYEAGVITGDVVQKIWQSVVELQTGKTPLQNSASRVNNQSCAFKVTLEGKSM